MTEAGSDWSTLTEVSSDGGSLGSNAVGEEVFANAPLTEELSPLDLEPQISNPETSLEAPNSQFQDTSKLPILEETPQSPLSPATEPESVQLDNAANVPTESLPQVPEAQLPSTPETVPEQPPIPEELKPEQPLPEVPYTNQDNTIEQQVEPPSPDVLPQSLDDNAPPSFPPPSQPEPPNPGAQESWPFGEMTPPTGPQEVPPVLQPVENLPPQVQSLPEMPAEQPKLSNAQGPEVQQLNAPTQPEQLQGGELYQQTRQGLRPVQQGSKDNKVPASTDDQPLEFQQIRNRLRPVGQKGTQGQRQPGQQVKPNTLQVARPQKRDVAAVEAEQSTAKANAAAAGESLQRAETYRNVPIYTSEISHAPGHMKYGTSVNGFIVLGSLSELRAYIDSSPFADGASGVQANGGTTIQRQGTGSQGTGSQEDYESQGFTTNGDGLYLKVLPDSGEQSS